MTLPKLSMSPFMLEKPDLLSVRFSLQGRYPEIDFTPRPSFGKAKRLAIINTANRPWATLDSSFLIENLSNFDVREFYYSARSKPFLGNQTSADLNIFQVDSFNQLVESLTLFQPSSLYLRVSPHTGSEHLITFLRLCFPSVVLIIEPYDMSCLFDKHALSYINNEVQYEDAMLGCAVALHYGEGLVVKMGGERYQAYQKPYAERMLSFFPSSAYQSYPSTIIESVSLRGVCDEKKRQVLYAGSLSARELECGLGSVHGANMLSYFDRILEDHKCHLTLINAAHFTQAEDSLSKFRPLLERYQSNEGGSRYLRSMPLTELCSLAKNFDLGICCAHYAEDHVVEVTRVSIPNRMTTYLNAELPVIIDDRFNYASSLITEFNAGKVIPAGNFDAFSAALTQANISALRKGVIDLKGFMQEYNNKNLASLLLNLR